MSISVSAFKPQVLLIVLLMFCLPCPGTALQALSELQGVNFMGRLTGVTESTDR